MTLMKKRPKTIKAIFYVQERMSEKLTDHAWDKCIEHLKHTGSYTKYRKWKHWMTFKRINGFYAEFLDLTHENKICIKDEVIKILAIWGDNEIIFFFEIRNNLFELVCLNWSCHTCYCCFQFFYDCWSIPVYLLFNTVPWHEV